VPVSTFINKICPRNHRDNKIKDAELFFSSSNTSTARLPPAVVKDVECESDLDSDLVFNAGLRPRKTKQLVSTLLRPSDCEENGDNEAPTMSEVISPRCSPRDPQTSIFRTQANKDAFVATLPKKTRLQLDQPFGED
jgi:hypothetical protein